MPHADDEMRVSFKTRTILFKSISKVESLVKAGSPSQALAVATWEAAVRKITDKVTTKYLH